jgi:hypothetical protein
LSAEGANAVVTGIRDENTPAGADGDVGWIGQLSVPMSESPDGAKMRAAAIEDLDPVIAGICDVHRVRVDRNALWVAQLLWAGAVSAPHSAKPSFKIDALYTVRAGVRDEDYAVVSHRNVARSAEANAAAA